MTLRKVRLQEIANARSGDKGNRLNIALVCRDPTHYPAVAEQITPGCVAAAFAARKPTQVVRTTCPGLPPLISCSTMRLKAESTPASASTATASPSRSYCLINQSTSRRLARRETAI